MSETAQNGPGEIVSSLGLQQGGVVEVMTPENRLIFVGKIDGIGSGAVSIREASDDTLPMVLVNKPLKLRFYRESDNVVLRGKVCGSTMRMWKVDRLESTFTTEQRAFFRQSISVEITAQCGVCSRPGARPNALSPCQVLDISAGGMLISSAETYEEGNYLLITDVPLIAGEPDFSFSCQVRRAGVWKQDVIRYGCQFNSLPPKEQDRLLRAIFTIQREEIRKRKLR